MSIINKEPWRSLRIIIFVPSTVAFSVLLSLFMVNSPVLYLGVGSIELYSSSVLITIILFLLSIGLAFAARNKLGLLEVAFLVGLFIALFSVLVPVVAVQKPYPVHCGGTYTEWQSISYHLLGMGSHLNLSGVCS